MERVRFRTLFCFQWIIIRAYSLCLILLLKYIIIYYDKNNFEKNNRESQIVLQDKFYAFCERKGITFDD